MSKKSKTDYGHIDATTPVGRIFYFGAGAIYGDIALPAALRLDTNVGGGVLVTDQSGALFPDEVAISHKEWNRHIARHVTRFTDPPAAPEKGTTVHTATADKGKPRRIKTRVVIVEGELVPAPDLGTEPVKDAAQGAARLRDKGKDGVTYEIVRILKTVTVKAKTVTVRTLV